MFGWTKKAGGALALAVLAACGGGGGGAEPEATVSNVATSMILEGNAGTSELLFTVTLNKSAVNAVRVSYSTASTAKAGGGGTGSASGGAACGAGVDYVAASGQTLEIAKGNSSGVIRVPVCTDAVFEPLETLNLVWSLGGASGTVTATIVNDDAGGLNGVGVASGFGRDSLALTNADADGRLGYSFATVAGAAVNCTRDNVTGLLWEGKTGAGTHDPTDTYTWAGTAAHVAAVNASNLCGFNDWRLPTPEEMASLVDNGAAAPTLDSTWLPNQQAGRYWTSTEYRDGTNTNAWFVDFATGNVNGFGPQGSMYFARLVTRGGTTAPAALPTACTDASRYTDHGDGTVTDNRTGLMWKQCAEGLSGAACGSGTAQAVDWAAAVARPATVNTDAAGIGLGYSDWRLPTRAELSSITEREQCNATVGAVSVVASVFPSTGAIDYWTQTPYGLNNTLAWRVNFADGEVGPANKSDANKRVRLVRAGQ
jgi:hypothetical protein